VNKVTEVVLFLVGRTEWYGMCHSQNVTFL